MIEKEENVAGHFSTSVDVPYRLSIVPQLHQSLKEYSKRILFIVKPMIIGLILFPIIVLFWECGWNVVLVLLNLMNGYPLDDGFQQVLEIEDATNLRSSGKEHSSKLDKQSFTQSTKKSSIRHKHWKGLSRPHPSLMENHDSFILKLEERNYSFQSLIISYIIIQIFLLCFYLNQKFFYKFLKKQNSIIKTLLLKCHIFFLATIYIIQWEMIWTIWDQYTPHQWYFELFLSLTFVFVLIVITGHLSDLVCAPFLISYDSIDYCIKFDCPLQTQQMKQWKINLINFVLYEMIISNITIIIWRGFYHFLDEYFYTNNWSCLLIGYSLYFLLMYFQNYLENVNFKYDFWIFISVNFPQFYRNIRHLLAFFSCVFLWRGFWIIYDSYINIFELYYQTYLFLYILSFLVLAFIQTASSTNGPLSSMEDENLLDPNCYISTVVKKFFQFRMKPLK